MKRNLSAEAVPAKDDSLQSERPLIERIKEKVNNPAIVVAKRTYSLPKRIVSIVSTFFCLALISNPRWNVRMLYHRRS